MKFSAISFLLLFGSYTIYSQTIIHVHADQPEELQALAGDDVVSYPGETVSLGAPGSATGGTEPYACLWEVDDSLISTESNPSVYPEETTIYTLLVTDYNSCTSSDEITVSIIPAGRNELSEDEICIYPNPTHDRFTVEYQGEEIEILLLDQKGSVLWRKRICETESFSAPDTPGTYLFKICTPGNESVKKISVCK